VKRTLLILLLPAACLTAGCGALGSTALPVTPPAPDESAALPPLTTHLHTLTVASDGCGVVRTNLQREPENLGWTVKDGGGFEVLQRNATGEDHYRHPQPGTYTVVLTAWDGDGYAPVSNTVSISC
jgi:hypothetical protein